MKNGLDLSRAVVQPIEGVLGQLVCDVAFARHDLAVDIEGLALTRGDLGGRQAIRREVGSLALEADPFIKAWAWIVVVLAHVPFAEEGGLVARVLEVLGEEHQADLGVVVVVDDPVVARSLAGQDRGAAGRAEPTRTPKASSSP